MPTIANTVYLRSTASRVMYSGVRPADGWLLEIRRFRNRVNENRNRTTILSSKSLIRIYRKTIDTVFGFVTDVFVFGMNQLRQLSLCVPW